MFRSWAFYQRLGKGFTSILNKHIGAWLGPATALAQELSRSQERYEEAHGTGWIVVQGRLRCAPGHLRHLSERESSALDQDKRGHGESPDFTDIAQDFQFSSGTYVDLRSQPDPPDESEPRHIHRKNF